MSAAHQLKEFVRRQPWMRPFRLARTDLKTRRQVPDWTSLLTEAERAELRACPKGARVLLATDVGLHVPATILDGVLAAALRLRGAGVDVMLCDGALPACMVAQFTQFPNPQRFVERGPRDYCRICYSHAANSFETLGLPLKNFSAFLDGEARATAAAIAHETPYAEIGSLVWEDLPLGEHAMAGALRYFARGTLEDEPTGEPVLRRYLEAAVLTALATRRVLREGHYDAIVAHHGIYVPQGTVAAVARQEGVRVVTWNPAYRKRCFIFSHDDTYHQTMLTEPTDSWENIDWTPALDAQLTDYLESRRTGGRDQISFNRAPENDMDAVAREFGIDFSKPTVALLTNVVWDAQLHYPSNALPTMMEWILRTIRHFEARPELQLVIRVHPAEMTGALPSRQRVHEEVAKTFPTLPPNVALIPSHHPANSYALAARCDSALVYATRMGVELTARGMPVIVAGEAWVRGKGFTMDAESAAHYDTLLAQLPARRRLDAAATERARKYAYHFFFRRMIPIDVTEPTGGWPPYRIGDVSIANLRTGALAGLDIVCNGILTGTPFIFPAEKERKAPPTSNPPAGILSD